MAEEKNQKKAAPAQSGQAQTPQRNQRPSGQPNPSRSVARRDDFLRPLWSESPFTLMRRFSEDMDRFFGEFLSDSGRGAMASRSAQHRGAQHGQWVPPLQIFERDNKLIVRADLPGLNKDDLNVEVTDDTLTISGERRDECGDSGEDHWHGECRYGRFWRSIELPGEINPDDMHASFHNGVLEISLPMPSREQHSRRIEIQEPDGGTKSSTAQSSTA